MNEHELALLWEQGLLQLLTERLQPYGVRIQQRAGFDWIHVAGVPVAIIKLGIAASVEYAYVELVPAAERQQYLCGRGTLWYELRDPTSQQRMVVDLVTIFGSGGR